MLFPTVGFAVFLPVVFVLAWLLRPWPGRWKAFLFLASVVFFGWWDWRAAAVLALMVAVAQVAALAVAGARTPSTARTFVGAAVVVDVVVFAVLARSGVDGGELGVVVPLGLGLLALRCISYVVDVHRRVVVPAPWVDAGLALTFFPAAVAGPLVRPSQLLPQLAEPADARRIPAARAFRLLLTGLVWLWVVSPYLGRELVDPVFAAPDRHSGAEVVVATYGATIQLFADLAGYAAMAIGAALLFGLRLAHNFDDPFTATSMRDYWRRWTTTFSSWFRDYVYVPLGGNRRGDATTDRNLLATMVVSGAWLAGGITGLVWGVLMGGVLIVERRLRRRGPTGGLPAAVGWLVTVNLAVLGWTLVRAGDLGTFVDLIGRLGSWGEAPLVTPLVLAVILGVVVLQFLPRRLPALVDVAFSRLPLVLQGIALGVGLLLIDSLGQGVAAAAVPARF